VQVGEGTENYRAPEIVGRYCKNFKAADVYSLGCLLFVLMTKSFVYDENTEACSYEYFQMKKESYWTNQVKKSCKNPEDITQDFISLIDSMLSHNPEDRPSIQGILESPYIIENLLDDKEYERAITSYTK